MMGSTEKLSYVFGLGSTKFGLFCKLTKLLFEALQWHEDLENFLLFTNVKERNKLNHFHAK